CSNLQMIETGLLLIGLVVFLGFFGSLMFERVKIPDVMVLLIVGILLGPVLQIVDPADFISWASLVGSIALIVILFDAGLTLNISKVLTEFFKATGFTLLGFFLTALLVCAAGVYLLGLSLSHALLLAFVIGGTSSNIVVPIVNRLSASQELRALLSLESVITDVFCVIATVTLLGALSFQDFNATATAGDVASAFSIALVVGFLFGLFWLRVLRSFFGKPLGYVVTLGVMFVLFNFVEFFGGSGAVGILVFALVLGNSVEVASLLRMQGDFSLDKTIKSTQTEVSFFVRTFFMVYLGLILRLDLISELVIVSAVTVIAALAIARWLAVKVLTFFDKSFAGSELLITMMMPRGLVAAVLAFLPAAVGIEIPGFVEIVFLVILGTNAVTTIGAFVYERSHKPRIVSKKG
ncbi:MAG: cation:proton antiporter, partial [Candidatus Micrarchaeota archaeon]